ncbi:MULTISPECIES: GNAT family N-acetyltransferase [Priestia]|uniref:Acetyltransferase, GNAT family n=5 Tax=Priestia megaterium TaxID=1404 RepID=D5DSH2_PRIM1|nr:MULTISPECIES: GNAT family N-acetyltransferase [Priestia]AVX08419.1 N-acetyltransferase [Bacillus sp. Y-01]KOP74567.1 GNAT family acetyltransferase [Bacillus sp. FJAT-21351]KQU19773.1 GNAT family acetyltransferase [Bacillus sp. Leaf75]KRF55864.1 GNAT family acetyltransferase [Bacillus sp. Soil531]MBZ5481152.1 GNAT family N-acetyltransferase [Bacillus sp. T_4]MCF6796259.1 GNAT family N-acetyltransferase [Bacillus sp. ET1]MCJ7986204.1 GNAT family N-acetyltransferase [Priestia sp. OVL9]
MKISRTFDAGKIAKLNQSVHQLHVELYPQHFQTYDFHQVHEFFKKVMKDDRFIFLLGEDEGQHVGFAWLEIKQYSETVFKKAYESIYVHQINIAESYKNKGFGSSLMKEIYSIARTNDINTIELDYWNDNTIAESFYEKEGFVTYRKMAYKEL